MLTERLSKALFAMMAVAFVGACGDAPVEPEDEPERLFTNPSFVVVNAGESQVAQAFLVNNLSEPLPGDVTFTACDATVTAAADTTQSPLERGTNIVITGNTLGSSCVVASAGGFEDTIHVRVVPADIALTGVDTVLSGTSTLSSVQFLSASGTPVTGFDVENVTFESLDEDIIEIDTLGNVTAKAPGTAEVAVILDPALGAPRADTISVVVIPGTFTGTADPPSGSAGTQVDFTSGATDPEFDASSRGTITFGFNTYPLFGFTSSTADTYVTQIPWNLPVGTGTVVFTGLGDAEVALADTWEVTATTTNDQWEPNNLFDGTPPTPTTLPIELVGLSNGDDPDDMYQITVAEETTIDLFMDWDDANGSHDMDLLIIDAAAFAFVSCFGAATGNQPEETSCTLDPGTYWIWVNNYDAEHGGSQADTNYYLLVTAR